MESGVKRGGTDGFQIHRRRVFWVETMWVLGIADRGWVGSAACPLRPRAPTAVVRR